MAGNPVTRLLFFFISDNPSKVVPEITIMTLSNLSDTNRITCVNLLVLKQHCKIVI